jgi:hypothetical protein
MPNQSNIDAFLADYPADVRVLTRAARAFLTETLPGSAETLDESARLIGYSYGPGYKGLACTLLLSRKGVKLGIVRGSELPDPRQLLEGSGKVHRFVQLNAPADLKRRGLKTLVTTAYKAWKVRNLKSEV